MADGCTRLVILASIILIVLSGVGYFVVNWLDEHPAVAGGLAVSLFFIALGVAIIASSLWTRDTMRAGAEMMVGYVEGQAKRDRAASSVLGTAARLLGNTPAPPQLPPGQAYWEPEYPTTVDADYQEVERGNGNNDCMA